MFGLMLFATAMAVRVYRFNFWYYSGVCGDVCAAQGRDSVIRTVIFVFSVGCSRPESMRQERVG